MLPGVPAEAAEEAPQALANVRHLLVRGVQGVSEVWREVPGFNEYEVSDLGNVRSIKTSKHLKPHIDRGGYLRVSLHREKASYTCGVHRLVLMAFVGSPGEGMQGAHQNGIRTDARLENLAWKTVKENCRDKIRHGTLLCGEAHRNSKYRAVDVERMQDMARSGVSHREIGALFGSQKDHICRILGGKTWHRIYLNRSPVVWQLESLDGA